jgi:signal transduction histidine kinase
MTIKNTILLCFIFLGLLICISSYLLTNPRGNAHKESGMFRLATLEQILTIKSDALEAFEESFAYFVSGETDEKDEFYQWEKGFPDQAADFVKIAKLNIQGEGEKKEIFDSIVSEQAAIVKIARQLFSEYEDSGSVRKNFNEYESAIDSFTNNVHKLVTLEKNAIKESQSIALQKIKLDRSKIIGIGTGSLILCIVFGLIISGHVNREITLRTETEAELENINKKLEVAHESLEKRVLERTADLEYSNYELEISRKKLRQLNKKIQTVREEEKLHLAREIHDDLGQIISYCKLDLIWIIKKLQDPGEKIKKKLDSLVFHLDNSLMSVRRISNDLRPDILNMLGITEAIKWQAQKFIDQTHVDCELDILPEKIKCAPDLSLDIFRVFQETLTNISRHAQATLVQIKFTQEEKYLLLSVKDNGNGFDTTVGTHIQSLGILGIKERAHRWGGKVDFESQPGSGTTVTMNIPVHRQL